MIPFQTTPSEKPRFLASRNPPGKRVTLKPSPNDRGLDSAKDRSEISSTSCHLVAKSRTNETFFSTKLTFAKTEECHAFPTTFV